MRERGGDIAIEVVLALPAQQHQHELASRQPFRPARESINAQVLAGQQQRFPRKDSLQHANWLEPVLLGDLNVASTVNDLGLGHVHEPHRQDQFGLSHSGLEIEHVGPLHLSSESSGSVGNVFK